MQTDQIKFISRVHDKPTLQRMLKALRNAGFNVEKLDAGYSVTTQKGTEVLKAMNGSQAYLCRYAENLFTTN